ncbi:MAG: hypothetical protein Q9228_000418 [Teloschistes exilis]
MFDMRPALSAVCWGTFLLFRVHIVVAQDTSGLKQPTPKGCFSSADDFVDQGSYTYQSPGYCQKKCVDQNKPVMGLAGGSNCGGSNAWTILLTGLNNNVGSVQDSSNADSNSKPADTPISSAQPSPASTATTPSPAAKSKPTSAAPAAAAQPDSTKEKQPATLVSTVVVTGPTKTQAVSVSAETTHQASNSPNTAGIAAGVVVGVVAVCGIVGGIFFVLRRRRRRAAEEEYEKNSANPFENEASRPPPSSGSMADSRLEPSVMMQRRQSDGSIADNQDYSRRILKVTNPDGT